MDEQHPHSNNFATGTVKYNMAYGMPPVVTDKKSAFSRKLPHGNAVALHTGQKM